MSVLIKGMTRPKNCFECHLTKWIDDGCAGCVADDKIHNASKPIDCPLVEIPAHGRLIDADKMCADLATVDPQYETMIEWCIQVTNAQPTVIEGSEDDEHTD